MTASASTSTHVITPSSEQEQATALWTYVHLRVPRFSSEAALQVIRRLSAHPDDKPKILAKRLRKELALQGVAVKHSAALDAASRLLGHTSWHAANQAAPKANLMVTSTSLAGGDQLFANWREVAPVLCEECDSWQRKNETPLFQLRFGPSSMILSARDISESGASSVQWTPLLVVTACNGEPAWLDDAPAALETLRRHLEEAGTAMLDGIAVLQLTDAYGKSPIFVLPETNHGHVCNSELILMREDDELNPGYEIARGDEMTCWSQFELAIKDHKNEDVVVDGGAWRIGKGRYIWQLSTLRPGDIVPGLHIRELGANDSARLYRRYKIAKRLRHALKHCEQTKRIEYLGTLAETYRVDLHKLLLAMNKADLSWEGYCAEVGEAQAMVPELPVGFVFALVERLKLEDPNLIFARPTRSELSRVEDDKLLRALMPRVDHVRYRLRSGVATAIKEAVRDAIEDFSTSMRMQKLQASGNFIDPKDPLPYLVYASDAEELRRRLESLGLVMYAGVMPHLISTKGVVEQHPNVWPYAIGNSLFLDIDFAERG